MAVSPRRQWRLLAKMAMALVVLMVVVTAAGALWVRAQLRGSLPRLDGEMRMVGLEAPVMITRDAVGVPTIAAVSRNDAARATGFLHAQERFFQMDLLRRSAAGELAELVGQAAVSWDREIRVHRFRKVAAASVAALEAGERDLLSAYVEGVNAGLSDLASPPFEYLVLRSDPVPWRDEDTVLAVLAMFIDLQPEDGATDAALGLVHDLLGESWYEFLAPVGGPWDAPIVGSPYPPPKLPSSRRGRAADSAAQGGSVEEDGFPGSNSWAVAGSLTAHGGALLANDMHLGLQVPNTWFRARLEWRDHGVERAVTGVTLPGTPLVVVGSTGAVAWGFTNSYGDFADLVVLETDSDDPDRYLGPNGWRRLERVRDVVRVKGAEAITIEVLWSEWGPVIDHDHRGRPRALRWTAHFPDAVNLTAVGLERARSVDEALTVAAASGIPAQNFVCADAAGRIGWTVMGRIPRRLGCDGRLPAGDGCRWQGWLPTERFPRIADPAGGLLWTANARVVDGEQLAVLGDGGYALGARAGQIRDALRAGNRMTERDMLAIQLDDRAVFLARWQSMLLGILDDTAVAADPLRAVARSHIEAWGGRAATDSVGYRLVREFRRTLSDEILAGLTEPVTAADPEFRTWRLGQSEAAVWRLLNERPPGLLPAGAVSWRELMLRVLDSTVDNLVQQYGSLDRATWGGRNTVWIRHPLSRALPALSRWLDMPAVELPGDAYMPRVQSPTFGASERMVVSPGREELGIFHMPCGQSGHPLSPFYRAGHEAWVRGEPTPFLPGRAVHELRLAPSAGGSDRSESRTLSP